MPWRMHTILVLRRIKAKTGMMEGPGTLFRAAFSAFFRPCLRHLPITWQSRCRSKMPKRRLMPSAWRQQSHRLQSFVLSGRGRRP